MSLTQLNKRSAVNMVSPLDLSLVNIKDLYWPDEDKGTSPVRLKSQVTLCVTGKCILISRIDFSQLDFAVACYALTQHYIFLCVSLL